MYEISRIKSGWTTVKILTKSKMKVMSIAQIVITTTAAAWNDKVANFFTVTVSLKYQPGRRAGSLLHLSSSIFEEMLILLKEC